MHDQPADHTPPHASLPTDRRAMLAGLGGLAAGALLAGKAHAGPLEPPTGPIAPTMKPLDEVEPRTPMLGRNFDFGGGGVFQITQPGSYYLTANSNSTGAFGVIAIAASNVTIDLMGFRLAGNSTTFQSAIQLSTGSGTLRNIVIRNGTIHDWTNSNSYGVNLTNAENCVIENLVLHNNRAGGVSVGPGSVIRHCIATNCLSGPAFLVAGGGLIHNCNSQNNGRDGIVAGAGSSVLECVTRNNGFQGINAGSGSTVLDCVARNNGREGIVIGNGGSIQKCTIDGNGNTLERRGITAGSRCSILENTISENTGGGIAASSDSTIIGNTIVNNRNASNQGSGIRVTGAGNRIEANNIVLQAPGIDAVGGGNLIIRNSLRAANPPFSLAGGNTTGPTVTSANIASSNNPHANYTF
ncbi:MAG: right-handed parallel beta-helix repeat-containing protein [Phycisphaerales bacterium]|nr:right-handed parallel beta-helix repeat-containing protein [Planctomycetota bacterium]MCH8509745.1 right-handed parallel beta-helix repeat-containing protein [Phycisphaerales bacterium]